MCLSLGISINLKQIYRHYSVWIMYLVVVAIIGCVNVKLGSLLIVLPLRDIVYRIKPDVVRPLIVH